MNRAATRQTGRAALAGAVGLALSSCFAAAAGAASWSVIGGYDYYQGPVSLTRGAVAAAGLDVANASLALGGVRYDDEQTGFGTSALATGAVRVLPTLALYGQGTRFFGDAGYRAWRLKLGPRLLLGGSRTLFAYVRDQEDAGAVTQSGLIESEFPLMARWKGRASGSYASAGEGLHGMQGAVGLGFSPVPWLELAGEVGMAQQTAFTSYGPNPHGLLPILGPQGQTRTQMEQQFSPTALISIRVSAP